MTLPTSLITAGAALLAASGAQVAGAPRVSGAAGARPVVVVASPALAADPRARAAIARAGAQLRVPRSPTEQLSVTHLFAARGATIVGAGLDRRVAVDPVAARYSGVRFVLLGERPGLARLRAALRAP
ncbi:MAG: hypothetical protein QOK21_685 [Solirubrobacteraceae bacterium]|jgi:hypothetical protein|nr:hypothetical protein [Solirubrobacteraceae bacterium]